MVLMLVIRGIMQVQNMNISNEINAMVSGIAGLSHIGITIALVMLLLSIKKRISCQKLKRVNTTNKIPTPKISADIL